MKASPKQADDSATKGKWSLFGKKKTSDKTETSTSPNQSSAAVSPVSNVGGVASPELTPASSSTLNSPVKIDFDNVDAVDLLTPPELEPVCLDNVINTLTGDHQYKTIMKEESSELLMSYTASGVYQAVKGQNIEAPQHPTWNTGVYETEKITNYSQLYIESSLDQAKKKARAKKPLGRVVGRTARWSEQGNRGSNEDRHVAFPYLHELTGRENPQTALSFYGVYDGHGGIDCADFVSKHLHLNFAKHPLISTGNYVEGSAIKQALTESFLLTNNQWLERVERCGLSQSSGSTAVVVVVQDKTVFIAWAGDSSAFIFMKNGIWLDFVVAHKPVIESEKNRIINLGGYVNNNRVNGILAVSRSFGDFKYGCVNPEPEIIEYQLTGEESFLVLACDGLTDVMEPLDVYNVATKCISQNQNSDEVSRYLAEEALIRGSSDNVSVVFVPIDVSKFTSTASSTTPTTATQSTTAPKVGTLKKSESSTKVTATAAPSSPVKPKETASKAQTPEQKHVQKEAKSSATTATSKPAEIKKAADAPAKRQKGPEDAEWVDDETPPNETEPGVVLKEQKVSLPEDPTQTSQNFTKESPLPTAMSNGSFRSKSIDSLTSTTTTATFDSVSRKPAAASPVKDSKPRVKKNDPAMSELMALTELSRQLFSLSDDSSKPKE